ncbi:CynX/NimT family MFS transporter [Gaiella sp.]|uniref:MFS transporter n=1 Tax=Gaiella sp. TaxID=2663207 RepID=UPI002E2F584C|nr:MFS transporter [Gaiella sp.]HEX5585265.1 MFS transporter [Gaiella sp.]
MFLAALALRPQVVGIGPLIDDIQTDLDASHAVAGLLGTIPVLCMGLFAPVGASLCAWLGTRLAMTIGLVLIGVFGILRGVVPSTWLVVLLTLPVGIGMGVGNATAPIAVRETVPERPATGTGVYATGIQIGATVAAAIVVPLAAVLGGWRGSLIALSIASCGVALAWTVLERGADAHVRTEGVIPRLPWRAPTAWLLAAIFVSMSSAYYGLVAWLPDAYVERGWSDRSAGGLVAALSLTAIPASFVLSWLSERHGGRRPWLIGCALVFLLGTAALIVLPGGAYAWALLAGIAQGGCFALVMTLPLDLAESRRRVGELVAMMLGVGYTLGAVSPFALGAVRDATGSFDAVLWVCVVLLAFLTGLASLLPGRTAQGAVQVRVGG